ncbi:hypothetical protein AVEN_126421-1 [Araneus ventricosus]|uniref:Uncharacterized protein n=1 Tax=Araneus ventricosus TaxID=182803 RepID=A0A4Y2LMJ5_ARAVE|nr:hypothetical protein AVEN_126416-1 [Araneus ventricosus]GBN14557.1 hypothetical protein AVEN_126421-1 [Araneus ventricosus]
MRNVINTKMQYIIILLYEICCKAPHINFEPGPAFVWAGNGSRRNAKRAGHHSKSFQVLSLPPCRKDEFSPLLEECCLFFGMRAEFEVCVHFG